MLAVREDFLFQFYRKLRISPFVEGGHVPRTLLSGLGHETYIAVNVKQN
jgi:hypothetical protein